MHSVNLSEPERASNMISASIGLVDEQHCQQGPASSGGRRIQSSGDRAVTRKVGDLILKAKLQRAEDCAKSCRHFHR